MSESTTCYVSPDYFAEEDPFADFIVHEVAHIFHNSKRRTLGLREAASARNGWNGRNVILESAAHLARSPRTVLQQLRESLTTDRA